MPRGNPFSPYCTDRIHRGWRIAGTLLAAPVLLLSGVGAYLMASSGPPELPPVELTASASFTCKADDGACRVPHRFGKVPMTAGSYGRSTRARSPSGSWGQSYYMLLNVAVGSYSGEPGAGTYPQVMNVDYVRACSSKTS